MNIDLRSILHFLQGQYYIPIPPQIPKEIPGALRAPDCFIFLCFCCFLTQNTPKSRRASRAGLLHFPMFCCFLTPNTPKNIPARFARRIASSSYVFAAFHPKCPKKNPARFARRMASFPYRSAAFRSQIPQKNPRRAARAGLLNSPMVVATFGLQKCKKNAGARRAPDGLWFAHGHGWKILYKRF